MNKVTYQQKKQQTERKREGGGKMKESTKLLRKVQSRGSISPHR